MHASDAARRTKIVTAALTALLVVPTFVVGPAGAAPGGPWSVPAALPSANADSYPAMVLGQNRDGSVMAAWEDYSGGNYVVMANRFVPGFGWQTASQVSLHNYAFAPSISTDAHGNAFLAWRQYNTTTSLYGIGYAFYSADLGWSRAVNMSENLSGITFTSTLKAGLDGRGSGFVAFRVYNGSAYNLLGFHANINGTNGTLQLIDVGGALTSFAVDGNPDGGAMVLFASGPGTSNLYAVEASASGTFAAAVALESASGTVSNPTIEFSDGGVALAVWQQSVSSQSMWSATWDASTGWSLPNGAAGSGIVAGLLQVAMAPNGVAVAAYTSYNGTTYVPAASRYVPGFGWRPYERLGDAMSTTFFPAVAVDDVGNAFIVYSQEDGLGNYKTKGIEFTSSGFGTTGFAGPEPGTLEEYYPLVAMEGRGRAMVGWQDYDSGASTFTPMYSRYAATDTAAPWVTIDRPFNGSSFGGGFARVTGYAEPGAQVSVNGATALTFPNGTFEVTVPLAEGANAIQARAVDDAGNIGYSNLRVAVQTDPAPLIAAERAQIGRAGWQDIMHFDNLTAVGGGWWPLIESDSAGNAFVLWYNWQGTYQTYAVRYTNGVGWGVPEQLRLVNGGNGICDEPEHAVSPQGNAIFVWPEYNATNSLCAMWVREWRVGVGWMEPFRVGGFAGHSYQPDAEAASDGQLAVAWRQDEGSGNVAAYAQIWDPLTGWGNRTRVSTNPNVTHAPSIAFDGNGTLYMTAAMRNGTYDRIVLFNHTRGGNWTNPTVLETLPGFISSWPHVGSDLYGNLTVGWVQQNGSVYDTKAGRLINGTWSGNQTIWANSWTWWPEVIVDRLGNGYIAQTEAAATSPNMIVAVAAPGATFAAAQRLDNLTYHDGGPRLSLTTDGRGARVSWDSLPPGGRWYGLVSEFNTTTRNWSTPMSMGDPYRNTNIPVTAPMPDGGMIAAWMETDPTIGYQRVVGRRYVPPETTLPFLTVTAPVIGFEVNVSEVRVVGLTEWNATVTVNGLQVAVAPNGSFSVDVPLVNGSNAILIRATDPSGNVNETWRNGTFDDPDRRRIAELEALNAALQDQLNLTNSSLWTALTGQNASLLAELAAQNATLAAAIIAGDSSLLAELAAQNASILAALGDLNADLLADLAAQNATLAAAIAAGDAGLLAELAAQNATLLDLIADLNADLLADLASQNADLLAAIASTNATLLAELAALDASVAAALSGLNATLLAELAAQDAELTQLIADTNATLLAELAAHNADLTAQIASTNSSLLASLAAQNSDLLARIASTNSTLLSELAAQNATLWAKLTADNGALWNSLNATNGVNANQNDTLAATQDDVNAAQAAAASAATMGMVGALLGVVGMAIGALAIILSRKRGPPPMESSPPPPHVEGVEVTDAVVAPEASSPRSASHGHSMGAEGELTSTEA